MKWTENYNYYILKTEHINTNIEASCILMRNVAQLVQQFPINQNPKKDIYFYLVEIAPENKKVSLSNMY
jgi:hypothetical protein